MLSQKKLLTFALIMQYYISDLSYLWSDSPQNIHNPQAIIKHVALDTRNIFDAPHALFFALKGQRLDAHTFVAEAYRKGIRNFIVQKNNNITFLAQANVIIVDDVLATLQAFATKHRNNFHLPIIAITGSNGKTIIKEWLFQLLENDYNIVRSPRSYNSQIGVALSLLGIEKRHNLGIFEAGISQIDEMTKLENMIRPNIVIFSNLGDAHNEGFDSLTQKAEEKSQLLKNCDICIYSNENTKIEAAVVKNINPKAAKITWSKTKKSDIQIVDIQKHQHKTSIKLSYKNQDYNYTIPFIDEASIENTIHCFALMLHLHFSPTEIATKMLHLQSVALRLEIKAGIQNSLIINDTYNLDFTSLAFALDFMTQQAHEGVRTLILSDIPQSGLSPDILYRQVANLLENKKIQKLITIGEDIKHLEQKISQNIDYQHYISTDIFLKNIKFSDFVHETILLKGARKFEFERIAARLELKAHRTVLEINLDALRHNLAAYNHRLSPQTKMLVMVKASAYGSGSAEVAKLLEYHRVDYLGVAYTDEAVALRKEGITLPILVLNPEEASFQSLIQYENIEPEVYCIGQLQQLLPYLRELEKPLKIHLKLDTGMRRLGFEQSDIQSLIDILLTQKKLYVQSIFSHLAASDGVAYDEFTRQQVTKFSQLYEQIVTGIGYRPMRHICNTSGIVRFPQYHFEMVRLGIGIYGVDSSSEIQEELLIVNTLKARISQIKYLSEGESVGYSRRGIVNRPTTIATISIGYADGFLRAAGNGHFSVSINEKLAPIIGNVCMDMCMIDITDIQGVSEGDEVVIFGQNPKVETLAVATNTIAYEVFTNISERVKRIYYRE